MVDLLIPGPEGKIEAKLINKKQIETIMLILQESQQNSSRLVLCWFQGIQIARKKAIHKGTKFRSGKESIRICVGALIF